LNLSRASGLLIWDDGISVMASQADGYRAKAVECDKSAASTRDPDMKSQFEDLARRWRELAALIERAVG
jgi:hypothetical protein